MSCSESYVPEVVALNQTKIHAGLKAAFPTAGVLIIKMNNAELADYWDESINAYFEAYQKEFG